MSAGICRTCNQTVLLLSDGTCELHYKSSRYNHCAGSFKAPEVEPCEQHTCKRCDATWSSE